jgi:transposase
MQYCIGVDMSKRSFDAAFNDDLTRKYSNDENGFKSFILDIKKQKYDLNHTRIGVESTGTYHIPFSVFLTKKDWTVVVLNPLIVSKASKLKLRPVKTDKLDSKIIRSVTLTGAGYIFDCSDELLKLKALVKERISLVKIAGGIKQRLEAEKYRINSNGSGYSNVLASVKQEIKKIEKELPLYNQPIQKLLRSIPGIGLNSAAALTAVIGNIDKFSSAKKLVAFLGLDCRVRESGTSIKGKGHLTKRGNKQLRCLLFNAAFIALLC